MSHPSWVRGLKLEMIVWQRQKNYVAPLVGAWIEIYTVYRYTVLVLSHPSWVRGLKYLVNTQFPQLYESHPSWVRGLKYS